MSLEKSEAEVAGCLRRLLRSRYILRSRNESWFKAIVDHRKKLEEVVATLGAQLEINESLGLTYLRPGSEEVEEQLALRLSKPRVLSPFASALMLHLRWQRLQFYLQPTGDDVPIIGVEDMREFLLPFSRSKIDAHFERQFRRAIEELAELQVLLETATGNGFFEITSLCDLLLPADQIQDLRSRAEIFFNSTAKDKVSEVVSGDAVAADREEEAHVR